MRALNFIAGHVIYSLAYTYKIPTENHPAKEQDCFELFPNCGAEELYVLKEEEKR